MSSAAGGDDEDVEATVRRCAPMMARRGMTAAEARQLAAEDTRHPEDGPFWLGIAAELDALEARARFRVIPLSQVITRGQPPCGNGRHASPWAELAERLERRFPDRWNAATADAVSAQCRDMGVPSVDVKRQGKVAKGCRKSDVEGTLPR